MKWFPMLVAVALAGSVLLSGCGKTEQAPPTPSAPAAAKPAPATPPTVSAPVAAPATAQQPPKTVVDLVASAKSGVDQAMALAKEGKYQEALALLQQKAAEVQSNPEAKKLIEDAVAQIKKMMADAAAKAAADKAGGALGGLGK
jgi:hypothetical protein